MNQNNTEVSFPASASSKTRACLLGGERLKRVVQAAGIEAGDAVRGVARLFKVMIFLHSAKDFASVKFYGIEDTSKTGSKALSSSLNQRHTVC